MDALGALFSLMALEAYIQLPKDHLMYLEGFFTLLLGLELGIFGSHLIWRSLHRGLLREAKANGMTIDELLEAKKKTAAPSSIAKGKDKI
ncbi:hypothetical protein PRK78_001359 [Emydomyces testavorans]|uniref:Uncharacterized protein n=1 Tax=Emydomyces testavorans TaxID=2070801 RepID=A0AAF0DD64_9EURO|nr:hypothetical protein PRK78_001359 [Emydomyces testavorans]